MPALPPDSDRDLLALAVEHRRRRNVLAWIGLASIAALVLVTFAAQCGAF